MWLDTILITKPVVLAVEGREEELLFGELANRLNLENVQPIQVGGKVQFRPKLKALSKTPRFAEIVSLGIVRDADLDPKSTFESICDTLKLLKLPAPKQPLSFIGGCPRIGILIMPDENSTGALEDLCLRSIANDPAIPCIDQFFDCIKKSGLPIPKNIPKAKVQAFLASREETGKRLGEAAQAGYWPLDHKAFEQARNFLIQLSAGN